MQDLPVELWLQIVSFLSPSSLHKLVGVNRLLFELVMNDKYQEVRFEYADREMERIFRQLEAPNAASRVRHLIIRPSMFLDCGDHALNDDSSEPRGYRNVGRTGLGSVIRALSPLQPIHRLALHALSRCKQLEHLTVHIYDSETSPTCRVFLGRLLPSIRANIRHLTLDVTIEKLQYYRSPFLHSAQGLVQLEHLELHIATSRFAYLDHAARNVEETLINLLTPMKGRLRTLVLSSSVAFDISRLLMALSRLILTNLHRLELMVYFDNETMTNPAAITEVLRTHRNTISHFVFRPRPAVTTLFRHPGMMFKTWLQRDLSILASLPKLHSLSLGLLSSNPASLELSNVQLPLKSLTITDRVLYPLTIPKAFDALEIGATDSRLEELTFTVHYFYPELLDYLASRFPKLLKLEIACYSWLKSYHPTWKEFAPIYENVAGFRMKWGLREIRTARFDGVCKEPHPDQSLMGEANIDMPSLRFLDGYRCMCSM